MMDRTDRHCRYFLRLFAPHALLYTEMVTSAALVRGDRRRLLDFDPAEHPLALQLGGADVEGMTTAAQMGAAAGYDEININIGCPSDRVQSGTFGACLMRRPQQVADCVAAMRARVAVPVTVKTRIGIEDGEGASARGLLYEEADYERLHGFISTVAAAGCETFIVHARKAVLSGFSPKDNREIPPLRYEVVQRLKRDFPALRIIANGGIRTLAQAQDLLATLDGVMIGREAYQNPYFLAELEQALHANTQWQAPTRLQILERLVPYAECQLQSGHRLHSLTRHISGMFAGQPGARQWRRFFSDNAVREGAGVDLLQRACELMRSEGAGESPAISAPQSPPARSLHP